MVATRFAVAAHILLLLAASFRATEHEGGLYRAPLPRSGGLPATSGRIALVVNTNPVVVRRIAGQLARAGLIRVHRGPGGAELARPPGDITLDDIWRAVNAGSPRPLVPLHARAPGNGARATENTAHDILADAFGDAEAAFRGALAHTTLEALAQRLARQLTKAPATV